MSTARNLLCLCLISAASLRAGEIVIEHQPFEVVASFEAKVMPKDPVPTIELDAKAWPNFTILSLAAHGASVRKGDPLITFETQALDERIEAFRRSHVTQKLAIAEAKDTLALAALEIQLERSQKSLADLEHDRGLCEVKATSDGVFYHGPIENGQWTTGELIRSLQPGSQVPLHKPLASLIPKATVLELVAHTDATTARQLNDKSSGIAVLKGNESTEVPVEIASILLLPNTDGRYQINLKPAWPKGLSVATGNPAEVLLLCYQNPKAIVVPTKALRYGVNGWTVEAKLADGKTERRSVKRGQRSGDQIEILSGLELGQVVVTP